MLNISSYYLDTIPPNSLAVQERLSRRGAAESPREVHNVEAVRHTDDGETTEDPHTAASKAPTAVESPLAPPQKDIAQPEPQAQSAAEAAETPAPEASPAEPGEKQLESSVDEPAAPAEPKADDAPESDALEAGMENIDLDDPPAEAS